jgi:hypothetical protein
LQRASWLRQQSISSCSENSVAGARTTSALGVSAHLSRGTPAASATEGWAVGTFSISPGEMFSPPDTIMFFTRSWMKR